MENIKIQCHVGRGTERLLGVVTIDENRSYPNEYKIMDYKTL